jgi:hypothetical protein
MGPFRFFRCFIVVGGCALACLVGAAEPPGRGTWDFDVVHRKNGPALKGLVIEETGDFVRIRCIVRKPGTPTVVFSESIPRKEIDRVQLLPEKERAVLRQRLEGLKRDREVLAGFLKSLDHKEKGNGRATDLVELRSAPWPPDEKTKGLEYRSTHFRLVSNAKPAVVQLAAIHLEQIFAAYARSLPPRTLKAPLTTVLLTRSLADYQAIARKRGLNILNPAFYDPTTNEVVCGSDLEKQCEDRDRVRNHHADLAAKIKERKAALKKAYKGKKIPDELWGPLLAAEKLILNSERRNDLAFAGVRDRLFQRLYHEAFHAYVGTFVYPTKEGPLPHWLNEGLAQIFETAIVEVGELRIGKPDEKRLIAVRTARAKGQLLSVTELLRSKPEQFFVAHGGTGQGSDRHYLASWAMAYYLTFDRKLLGTKKLDEYVASLKRGTDPLEAFQALIGKKLADFEKDYQHFLRDLRADGSVTKTSR